MDKLFTTQEIGSLQRPLWRLKLGEPNDKSTTASAELWGRRLGVEELGELVNDRKTGLLQKAGGLSDDEKNRIVEIASIYAIRMFEVAGLDRVYNGEQVRTEMYDFLARYTKGIETAGILNSFDANYFRKGSADSKVSIEREGIKAFADEFRFALGHSRRIVKPCLTGPYTMMDWSYLEHYTKLSSRLGGMKAVRKARGDAAMDFARNVLNPIVRELAKAGAKVIQIDEPAAATDEFESELFTKVINESFKGLQSGVERAVHLCYSNYAPLFPALADCVADSYLIELTNHASPEATLIPFKDYTVKAKVGVGVIDIHSDVIETPQVVRDRLALAAKALGDPAKVQVNPDCGLRTRRWDVAFPKLCNMVEGAAMARSEYGD